MEQPTASPSSSGRPRLLPVYGRFGIKYEQVFFYLVRPQNTKFDNFLLYSFIFLLDSFYRITIFINPSIGTLSISGAGLVAKDPRELEVLGKTTTTEAAACSVSVFPKAPGPTSLTLSRSRRRSVGRALYHPGSRAARSLGVAVGGAFRATMFRSFFCRACVQPGFAQS